MKTVILLLTILALKASAASVLFDGQQILSRPLHLEDHDPAEAIALVAESDSLACFRILAIIEPENVPAEFCLEIKIGNIAWGTTTYVADFWTNTGNQWTFTFTDVIIDQEHTFMEVLNSGLGGTVTGISSFECVIPERDGSLLAALGLGLMIRRRR